MKKYTIFFIFLLLSAASVQAQYTGGIGRGDFKLDYAYPVIVSNANAGSNGGYASLRLAFDAINAQVQTGFNITITIVSNTTDTASAVLNAGLWTTLSIYPTVTGLSITGNLAAPLIDLNGADNVTFDGRVSATGNTTDLVISNTSILSTAGTSTIRFINDACSNTVKYCAIKGSSLDLSGGVLLFSTTSGTTGNDNNTIDYCNITCSGDVNRPINILYALGSSGKDNSGNTISNNNFYNFMRKGAYSNGILLFTNNTAWTISGNSFYETSAFVPTASTGVYYMIYIQNSGSNYSVTGNYIGGTASLCGGTAFTKSSPTQYDNIFGAIYLSTAAGTASSIQGNTISNMSWTNSGTASWRGILTAGSGDFNIGTTAANTIGASTGNSSISYTGGATGASFYGMYLGNTGTTVVHDNIIGSVTASNAATNATSIYGIYKSGAGTTTISNNTIGSTTTANSINTTSASSTADNAQLVYGILSEGSGNVTISDNTVSKLTNGTTNTNIVTTGLVNGIATTGGINTISNNTVRDLTNANGNYNNNNMATVTGICQTSTAAGQTVSGNVIYNLTNTYTTPWGLVQGLYYRGGSTGTNVISGNFIHSLSFTNPTTNAMVYGLQCTRCSATFSNNIISLGNNLSTDIAINGIRESCDATYNTNFYFNTVYLYGSAGDGSQYTTAFYSNRATNIKNIRNNIFVNNRAGTYPDMHSAIRLWGTSGLTIDYNDYHAPNAGGVLGQIGSPAASYPTLSDWQTITGQDSHSLNTNPSFASAGGTLPENYKPTVYTLNGVSGTGILTDYPGLTRSLTSPTMGAYEVIYPISVTATSGIASGSYLTLQAAFAAINLGTHLGAVTIKINGSTTETSTAVLYASGSSGKAPTGGGSNYTSVLVYPTTTGLSISGNLATPLIDLNGATNVTIDGRVNQAGEKNLIITNTSTSATAETSTIRFINDASSNTVKYCTIKGSSTAALGGVIYFSSTTGTTGNDNNSIDNNDITCSTDVNRPVNALYSSGTSTKENSGNTVSNNNLYNFFSRTVQSFGINLQSYSTNWTIMGNSFYETATFVPTLGSINYYMINVAAGNYYTINGNRMGGSGPRCAGTWIKNASTADSLFAISVSTTAGTATEIQGNCIQNINWSNYCDNLMGIRLRGNGAYNVGTSIGNRIGGAIGNDSIVFSSTNWVVSINAIYIDNIGTSVVKNNVIGGITATATANMASNIYMINKSSTSGTTTISDNIIGSTDPSTSNSIRTTSPANNVPQTIYGIYSAGTGTVSISGNTVSKLTNGTTNAATGTTGLINGITTTSGTNTISNNTVRDLTIANANNSSSNTASVIGISHTSTTTAQTISGNTIYNLSNTYASFAGNVIGLYYNGSTTASTVSGNFIHSFSMVTPSTNANMYGIKIQNGRTTWSNNIISIGSNFFTNIYGIYERGNAGNDNSLYFNTVYISGDVGSNTPKSYALYSATSTNTRDFRNNIFDNQRFVGAKSPGAIYSNYAAWFNYGVSTNLTLDNNDYYISVMGSGVLGYYNSADVASLPLISGKDAGSKSVDPGFASAGGTAAANYLPSNNTLIAVPGTGITTDYSGATRNTAFPSMGAWEYNVSPTISVTASSGTLTGGYTTLKAAFDAINAGTHQGAVTVMINGSTTETASAVLNASTSGSALYTSVNIYPTISGLSVSGNLATPLIDLNGADNVTLDGRVNAAGSTKDLVITNTSISTTLGTSTIRFINDASGNTVKYCTLKGSQMIPNIPGYGSGIVLFSTGTITGNDGNLIDHNNITNAADVNRPINAIFSLGTSGMENSGNTISNNNIYDFFIRDASFSTGICVRDNNTNWTISGNSFYESASFAATGPTSYYFIIYIESGSGHTVSSNYIGGSAPACSGTWTKTGNFAHEFMGICINSPSNGTACEIQGNIIRNISWTSGSSSFTGIKVAGSIAANIGTTTPNVIGAATGNGSVTYTLNTTYSDQTCYGIATTSTGTVIIQNNTVGAITTNNSNTGYPANFYGIHSSGTGDRNINTNTIGSTDASTSNSINAASASTAAIQNVNGIYSAGSGIVSISGNTISKLTNGTTNTDVGAAGLINGITAVAGTNTISNNTVNDLTIANANFYATHNASVSGIALYNLTAVVQKISGNTIYNLSNTYVSFTGYVIGLYYNGSATASTVSGNFIHNLSVTGASSTAAYIHGIKMMAGSTTYANNIISLGGNTKTTIYGIFEMGSASTNNNLYFNTVYIGGTLASGSSNKSYALYSSFTTNTRSFTNNILINARSTTGGSDLHYATWLNYATSSGLTLDYNDYYAPGTGGVLGYYNFMNLNSLPLVEGMDANSKSINPSFANAGGTLAVDYLPSALGLFAATGTGILTDYGGITRSVTTPSMGAWEYNANPPITVTCTSGTSPAFYSTLKAAFDAINLGNHQGAVTVMINISTTETASAVLNTSSSPSSYTAVNIYPTASGLSISGNLSAPLVNLNGATNVTIDGRVNATGSTKDLVITNTSTSTSASGGISAIRFINDACSNMVKYCTIKASSPSTNSGIINFSTTTGSSGNDNNTIDNNNITNAADANRPVNAIYSNGTAGKENSGNIVSTNNIYNFLNRGSNSQGIYLYSNTTSCTISGNSFYETATFVPTAHVDYKSIKISNAGNNFTVSGNYIGGNSPACSGTWTKTSFDNDFCAIYINVGNGTASNIQGNTIRNFSWSNTGGVGTKPCWYGIYEKAGSINVGTTAGNIIGAATGTGSIIFNAGDSDGPLSGIFLEGDGPNDIRNNQIGSITVAALDPTKGHIFCGIYNLCTGITTIHNNTIGSETTALSINLSSPSTVGEQMAIGIFNSGPGSVTASDNTIANMANGTTNSSADVPGCIYGILTIDGSNTISNNTIRDLTIANADTAGDYTASIIGIGLSYTTTGNVQTITGNTIYNLSNTYASFAGSVIGLYYEGSTTSSTVSGNFIHSLSVSPTSTTSANLYGIKMQNGATTWANNIISLGSNALANIYGIYERGDIGNDNSLYYNTIYISGTIVSTMPRSYALYSATSTNIRNFRNNILVNQRSSSAKSPGGLGTNYAAWFNYNVSTNLTLDNNDYYASGNGGVLGYYNSANVISLPLVSGQDASSKALNPAFASAGGILAANYLPSTLGLIAATGTGISTDYDGNTRSSTFPAMGAWEYNVTPCPNPTIISQSTGAQTQCIGGTFNPISVTATGANLSYHWYSKPDQITSGGTAVGINSNSYTPLATVAGTLYYYCVVTDSCGTATSAISGAFVVNPLPAPTIYSAGSTTFCQGDSVTLNVSGNALQFGSNSSVEINDNPILRFTSAESYTVMAWVYVQSNTYTWRGIVTKSRDQGSFYGIWIDPGNRWTYGTGTLPSDFNNITGSIVTTGWHHIAIVQTGSVDRKLFVDGVSVGTGTVHNSDGTGLLRFGRSGNNFEEFEGGILDEVSIFNTNLSSATINTWKNVSITSAHPDYANLVGYWKLDEGTGTTTADASGHGLTGTLVNSPVWVATSAPVNLFSSYLWSPGSATTSTLNVTTSGTYTVTVTDANSCSNTAAGVLVTVNPLPVPTISGSITACTNSTGNVYTTQAAMTAYSWSIAGGIITSGGTATDNSATVTWTTSGAESISVNYTNGNGCTASTATVYNVTVDPVSVGGSIAGGTTVCSGTNSTTLTLSGHTGSVVKWQSSINNWTTITDITNITTTLVATNLTATTKYRAVVQSGVCSEANSSDATVEVNPLGQVNQPADQVVCNSASTTAVTFGTTNTGGTTTYAWTNTTPGIGLSASGTGNIASFTAVNTGIVPVVATIVVTPTFTGGSVGCAGPSKTFTITVNPTGQVNQPSDQVVCNSASTTTVTFGTTNTGGTTTYAWTNTTTSIGLAASGTGNIASFTAVNTGTAPVVATIVVTPTYTNGSGSCAGPTKTFTITVNPTGQVNQPASQVVCNNTSTTTVVFGTTSTGGTTTYAWINDTPGIGLAAAGSGNIASFTAVNTGTSPVVATIVVTPTFTGGAVGCEGTTKTFTITVNPTGQVTQPVDQVLCNGSATSVTFATVNTGGTTTYAWTNTTTSIGLAASGTGNIASFTAVNTGTAPVIATIVVTPTFTNGAVGCAGPTKTFTITVNPTGQVNQPADQVVCNSASTTAVTFGTTNTGGTTTYAWTNSTTSIGLAASGIGNIASFTAVNTGTAPVIATIVVTPTFTNGLIGCAGPPKTFTITVNPTGQVNQPANQVVCNNTSTTTVVFGTTSTGGTTTYAWTNDTPGIGLLASGTGNISSFTAVNTGTAPVVATIVVTPTFTNGAVGCAGPTKTFTITVNPTGQVNQPADQLLCNGSLTTAVTFGTLNTGGTTTYAWTNTTTSIGLAASGTGNIASFAAVNTGTSPVVATIVVTTTFTNGSIGCAGPTKTFTITVNPTGQVNQPANQVVCNNTSTTTVVFGTTSTGGTTTYAWTNDTPGIGLLASGTGNIASFTAVNTGTSPVVATIVVTPTFTNGSVGCAGPTRTFTITVNPTGQVNQPADQLLCNGSLTTAVTFGTLNTGGTTTYAWTNTTTSIGLAASGTGNIASFTAVNTGTSPVVATIVVTPTFTNGSVGCAGPTKTFTITVNPTGQVNQPADQVVCNSGSTTAVTFGTTNTGGTTTYAWTNTTTSIGLAASGTGNIASFTAVNTGTAPVIATIVVTPTFTNGSVGCAGPTKTFTITVNPTGQINQPANQVLCNASATAAVTFGTTNTGGTTTYAWTNDTPGIGLLASGTGNISSFTAVNNGTAPVIATIVVTPTFTNGSVGCAGPTKTFTITVNPTGQVNQPADQVVCNGAATSVTFATVNTGGTTTYAWTNNNPGIGLPPSGNGNISFNAINTGTSPVTASFTVTPTFTNGAVGCAGPSKTFTITVNPTGQVNQPANQVLCHNTGTTAVIFSTVNTGGTTSYTWTNTTTSIGLAASGSGNIPSFTAINPGTVPVVATIVVTPTFTNGSAACPGPSKSFTITVNPLPIPIITGQTSNICPGSGYTSYFTQYGNSNYIWTTSPGGTIAIGQGTAQADVYWTGSGPQWITVNYTNPSGCTAAAPAQLNVTVMYLPGPAGAITGTATVCAGTQNVAYSVAPVGNATAYIWNLPAGASIASGGGTNSIIINFGSASGNITVAGSNACGQGTSSPALVVTVNPIPATPVITANGYVLTSSAPGGNQWYHNGTAVSGATGQTYTVPVSQPGWYWTEVTLLSCTSDTSNHLYVRGVGIAENNERSFTIYPVPNNGRFTAAISWPTAAFFSIAIYNGLGAMIYQKNDIRVIGTATELIELISTPPGVYTVVFTSSDCRVIRKFIISD